MAESTLSLGFTDYKAEVGRFIGVGRTEAKWSAEALAEIEAIVHSGIRQFYNHPIIPRYPEHSWGFLKPIGTITVNANYSTGTVVYDHTGGANERELTLTTGVWPSWAALGKIEIDNIRYDVDTRVSDTVITFTSSSNPGADVASTTYKLVQEDYPLPDDFGSLEGEFTYQPGQGYTRLEHRNEFQIRDMRRAVVTQTTGRPYYSAIRPMKTDGTTGQRFEALFFPTPDAAYVLEFRYEVQARKLTTASPYPYGGSTHSETILESCLAIAEERENDEHGIHKRKFMEMLEESVRKDYHDEPDTLGYNGDNSDGRGQLRRFDNRFVEYNGVIY